MLIRFEQLSGPVAFEDGSESLLGPLGTILAGWDGTRAPDSAGKPVFSVHRERGAFRIDTPWLDEPVIDPRPLGAAGNLAVDLAEAWLADNPSLLSIHCAAALFDGRLVIFPSRARAGKSTLSARLAAAGVPVVTDDLLVLTGPDDRMGMSLGLTVRLCLPLPPGASDAFRSFVAAHSGPSDADYVYLALPDPLRPAFGKAGPVSAIVLLDRRDGGDTGIAPASRGDGLQELVLQNLSLDVGAYDAMPRMRRLIENLPCFTLLHSDLDAACAALRDRFADWDSLPVPPPGGTPAIERGERPFVPDGGEPRYVARPEVAVHVIDGGRFLVSARNDSVYRLNDISFGLWNLVGEPTSALEAAAILHGAFPEAEGRTIERDVRACFADMAERDLIRPA